MIPPGCLAAGLLPKKGSVVPPAGPDGWVKLRARRGGGSRRSSPGADLLPRTYGLVGVPGGHLVVRLLDGGEGDHLFDLGLALDHQPHALIGLLHEEGDLLGDVCPTAALVLAFDASHGVVHELADRGLRGLRLQVRPARFRRHPEDIHRAVRVWVLGVGTLCLFRGKLGVVFLEGAGEVLEEDQAKDDVLILRGVHRAAQSVRHLPELGLYPTVAPTPACRVGRSFFVEFAAGLYLAIELLVFFFKLHCGLKVLRYMAQVKSPPALNATSFPKVVAYSGVL